MQDLFNRAFQDTCRSYGYSWREILRKAVVAIGTVAVLYLILGGEAAFSEAWVIVAAVAAAVLGTFVPEFLLNLWLAPYRNLHDLLDKIAAAQPPEPAVNEEAQERIQHNYNKQTALWEMKDFRRCLDARIKRNFAPLDMRGGTTDFDHQFLTLKEKYSDWLPRDLVERDMRLWVGRIIAILKAFEYPDAEERIKQAASLGTWKKEVE